MEEFDDISLLELQSLIRDGVEDAVPGKLWVRAEIASIQSKNHCYLELCQSESGRIVAKARAVIWKGVYTLLRAAFKDATGGELAVGMQILARVQPNYSEIYGLSLVIDDIEPQFTLGAAELEKRKTIELLEKEGYMEMQKELALPDIPKSLAVISSGTAAGFGDFCRHLDENPYGFKFRVQLFEALMQGEDAPASIAKAIESVTRAAHCSKTVSGEVLADTHPQSPAPFDAVLILRGGGSPLDLACFDDYSLAVAIARCPLPVVTAIGHDRDHHVADMVAHDFVKTPTALADMFIDAVAAEDERLSAAQTRIRQAAHIRLVSASSRLELLASSLRAASSSRIVSESSRLDLLLERIGNADPRNVLGRGFAIVTDEKGMVLRSVSAVAPGSTLRLIFADGSVSALATAVVPAPGESNAVPTKSLIDNK